MGYHRRHRKDANHDEIAEAFTKCGWCVFSTSQLGCGFPDLVISKAGRTMVIEVKSGDKALRASQERFLRVWPGESATVRTVNDVLVLTKAAA